MAIPIGKAMLAAALLMAGTAPAHAITVLDQPATLPAAELMAPASRGHAATPPAHETRGKMFDAAISAYAVHSWIGAPDEATLPVLLAGFLKGAAMLAVLYAILQRHLFMGTRARRPVTIGRR